MARLRRILRLTAWAVYSGGLAALAFVLGSFGYGHWYASSTETARHEVWSAYLSDVIYSEPDEVASDPRRQVLLVIQDHSDQAYRPLALGLLWPATLASNPLHLRFPSLQTSTLMGYLLGNLGSHPVRRKLTLAAPYRLADKQGIAAYGKDWPRWEALFPDSAGYYVLSTVGFSTDQTQALLRVDYVCGLCGGGGYVLMQKVKGKWVVKATATMWVS